MSAILIVDPRSDQQLLVDMIEAAGHRALVPNEGQNWRDYAPETDGMIVNLTKVDAAAMNDFARCKVIARLGVGVDSVDLGAAREKGIVVANVPEYCVDEVSDHTLALILSLVRKLAAAEADVRSGIWDQLRYRPIRRASELTLGLVGVGRLGEALARKAAAIGFNLLAHDPHSRSDTVQLVPLDELLAEADILSLHAPSLPETKGMIGAKEFAQMKRGALIVNTSRGELIDEVALVMALNSGQLGGAALDVFAEEPLPLEAPLRECANVLMTPHIAFYSEESVRDLQRKAVDAVLAVLAGAPVPSRVA